MQPSTGSVPVSATNLSTEHSYRCVVLDGAQLAACMSGVNVLAFTVFMVLIYKILELYSAVYLISIICHYLNNLNKQ